MHYQICIYQRWITLFGLSLKTNIFGGESMFLLTAFLLAIGGVHMYILETPHTFPLPNMSMDQSTVNSVDLTSKHIFSVYSISMFIIMTK